MQRPHQTRFPRNTWRSVAMFHGMLLWLALVSSLVTTASGASFRPKWTAATSSPSSTSSTLPPLESPTADVGRIEGAVGGGHRVDDAPGDQHGGVPSRATTESAGGSQGETCGAPFPADTPTAPTYRQRLNIPGHSSPPPDHSSDVDPARCTLHVPPGTSFRHGVTVGFTVMARNSAGAAISAPRLPFVYNLTNVGDSSSGSVFDLQNGTYFVYR
jgi:hypothetical protein